eukprot:m51a1_g4157 putative acetolactate synthase (723) ;mRNA; r:258268-260578
MTTIESRLAELMRVANAGEMDKVAALFSPAFVADDPDLVKHGVRTPTEAIALIREACPDVQFCTVSTATNEKAMTAFMLNRITGTHTAKPICGFEPVGTRFEIEYIQYFQYDSEGLVSKRVSQTPFGKLLEALAADPKRWTAPTSPEFERNKTLPFKPFSLVARTLDFLRSAGIDTIFGVSGGNIGSLFDMAEAMGLNVVCSKHEESAAFQATFYSMTSRRPCVLAATSGPGVLNMINGVMLAKKCSQPVLCICGTTVSEKSGFGTLQEMDKEQDQIELYSTVTKSSMFVSRPERFAGLLSHSLGAMLSGRKGPAALHVPHDYWETTVNPFPMWVQPSPRICVPPQEDITRTAWMLRHARRPVMIIGNGVRLSGAEGQVAQLAEAVPCAVVTSAFGKNLYPECRRLSSGMLFFGGTKNALSVVEGADVILVVGSSLSESTLPIARNYGHTHDIIRIDIDELIALRYHTARVTLIGDAAALVTAIYRAFMRTEGDSNSVWRKIDPPRPSTHTDYEVALSHSDAVPIESARVKAELGAVLPADAVVAVDIGSAFLNMGLIVGKEGQEFFIENSWASMGQVTAGVIGIAMNYPGRPVIAVAGDGSFLMNGMEVVTAVEKRLPIVYIIENNSMQAMVHFGSKLLMGVSSTIGNTPPVDFAKLAEAYGARGWSVRKPQDIRAAITEALACKCPCVIDIKTARRAPAALENRIQQIVTPRGRALSCQR